MTRMMAVADGMLKVMGPGQSMTGGLKRRRALCYVVGRVGGPSMCAGSQVEVVLGLVLARLPQDMPATFNLVF